MFRKSVWVVAATTIAVAIILSTPAYAEGRCKYLTGEPGGPFEKTLWSGGLEREYLLYVPERYNSRRPTPLVFLLHGAGGTPEITNWYTNMTAMADVYKFILVTPKGIGLTWDVSSGSSDVTFVADMIEAIGEEYCIHPDRIFATGISRGGGMSHRLACDLSDHIAAIGPVAGVNSWYLRGEICEPERPVPMILFIGTEDVMIPWEGGSGKN